MKNVRDVENPLNFNVLSAIGSIMQCLCQLNWRKTMGQMVKWRGRQQLNLWFWCVNANRLHSRGQHKLCLWKYTEMSGISAACRAVLAPAQWDVSHCAQQMGAGKFSPGTEAFIHMHKKINTYIVCVTRPWQRCCWESHWAVSGCMWASSLHALGTSHEHSCSTSTWMLTDKWY